MLGNLSLLKIIGGEAPRTAASFYSKKLCNCLNTKSTEIHDVTALERRSWIQISQIKMLKTQTQAPLAFNCQIDLMVPFKFDRFFHPSMADNVIACQSSSVIYPNLPLSLSPFQNSLFSFSIERVNEIPFWDFCASDFQRVLKIIAELFIIMTISPG